MLCDYSLLFTLCEIDVVSFHLIETIGFYITTEKKRFTAAGGGGGEGLGCRQNFKFQNLTSSFGRLRQRNVLKCVLHVQHDYLSLFNESFY